MTPCSGLAASVFLLFLLPLNIKTSVGKGPIEEVEAIAGTAVRLPCRVRKVDRLVIVLWYRKKESSPFYSFDARSGNLSAGSRQIHDNLLGPRSQLILLGSIKAADGLIAPSRTSMEGSVIIPVYPGWLEIRPITRKDSGSFICRAEFEDAPTQTHHLRLTVYELPEMVQILDSENRPLRRDAFGKLKSNAVDEGDRLTLACLVKGGWPEARAEWRWGGESYSNKTEQFSGGWLGSRVQLPPLRREDRTKSLFCSISNNPLTKPNITVVDIDLNLRPLSVKILRADEGMEAGKKKEILCISRGSSPPANLTWIINESSKRVPYKILQNHTSGDTSESRIIWTAQAEDNLRRISCLAINPRNTKLNLTATTVLNVFHSPIVELRIGRELNPNHIKEGADVYFTCEIKSNPIYDKMQFYREGDPLKNNETLGLHIIEPSLVLQKVNPSAAGNYSCSATSVKGTANSNGVNLKILYAPRCKESRKTIAVSEGGNVTVECAVEALPKLVHFSWSLNSSDEHKIFERDKFEVLGQSSFLNYQIESSQKKVNLLCSSTNVVGEQERPCVITLVAAGIPDPVRHCFLSEQYSSSFRISCRLGGGAITKQTYLAQVVERNTGEVVVNQTSTAPDFRIVGLAPGMDYVIHVISINRKGRSIPYLLEGLSLKVAENRMDSVNEHISDEPSTILGLFLGIVLTVSVLVGALAIAARMRCKKPRGAGEARRSNSSEPQDPRDKDTTDERLDCTAALLKSSPRQGYGAPAAAQVTQHNRYELDSDNCPDAVREASDVAKARSSCQDEHRQVNQPYENVVDVVASANPVGILKSFSGKDDQEYRSHLGTSFYIQDHIISSPTSMISSRGEKTPCSDYQKRPSVPSWSPESASPSPCRPLVMNTDLSPTSSASHLIPPLPNSPIAPLTTSFTLGRFHTRTGNACTRRPSESFV